MLKGFIQIAPLILTPVASDVTFDMKKNVYTTSVGKSEIYFIQHTFQPTPAYGVLYYQQPPPQPNITNSIPPASIQVQTSELSNVDNHTNSVS